MRQAKFGVGVSMEGTPILGEQVSVRGLRWYGLIKRSLAPKTDLTHSCNPSEQLF